MDPIAILQLSTALIQSLATLASNVTSRSQGQAVGSALQLTAAAMQAGEQGVAKLQELTAHVQQMAAAGVDPTDAEFDALKARSDAAHVAIQGS